jgi:streptogramin lyase
MGIVAGPDGRLWFTESSADKIGALTTTGHLVEYPVTPGTAPSYICVAPGGTLAYTSGSGNLGFMTTEGLFGHRAVNGAPIGVVAGPDGRVWFASSGTAAVVGVQTHVNSPATQSVSTPTALSAPWGVALGAERWIWFTEHAANKVGSCPPYGTSCSDFPIPTAGSEPLFLALGADSNLWFTELSGNNIGRVTRAGVITEFPLPTPFAHPFGITLGPDGNIWFTELSGNKIGRITPAGVITEFPLPSADSGPQSICTGPDGALWFTEFSTGKIGRFQVFLSGDANGDGDVDVRDVFYLVSFLFAGGAPPK